LNRHSAERLSLFALVALLLVAFGFGGGGSRYAIANLIVQLVALAALAANREAFIRFWREAPLILRAVIAVCLIVPLLQILPLPPAIWSQLPGRDLVVRSLDLVGTSGWMTFSVNPVRTLLAWTALVTPLAVLTIGWPLPRQHLITLGWLVVGLGLVTAILGVFQLAATNTESTVFGARASGEVLLGTFANRNSTGLFLGFALGLAAVLPPPRPRAAIIFVRVAVCALLFVAIILTKSRTALVLASIPVGLAGLRILWWAILRRSDGAAPPSASRIIAISLGAVALAVLTSATLLATAPGRISETLERFEAKDDPRRFIWDDATYSVARYWPAGAGTGNFDEVAQVDEALENMTQRRAGRAHNDYIELAIELGAFGLAMAMASLVLLAWMSWKARLSDHRWTAWAASGFLLAIALQSITDYPLRNQTMLAMTGLAVLLLARSAAHPGRAR
jgi:hypothetical protein